jgi:hypothetical protein
MKPNTLRRPLRRRQPRGQALVEYSIINWFLILALVVMMESPLFGKKNVISLFMEAYQMYYDSFHFVLNLPFP